MAYADRLTGLQTRSWKTAWGGRPRLTDLPLAAWLPTAVLVFTGSAFLLPSEAAYAWPFYLMILPAWISSAARRRPADRPAQWLALGLIAWSGLTLLWGQDDGHRIGRFALETVWTLVFVLALLAVLPAPALRRQLGSVLIGAATANALFSVAFGIAVPQGGERLHGWGVTSHPILGAIVMAAAYLCTLSRALSEPRHRATHAAAALAMAAFIVMTESRGPIFSALAGTLFLCAAGPWRLRSLAVLAAIGVGWLLLPPSVHQHEAYRLVYRGSSHHFEVWDRTVAMIAERPLLGHGLAANLHLPDGITFPHDLYLSVFFYSGTIGFAVFATLCLLVTLRLWRSAWVRDQDWLWVTAMWMNTLLSGLTDLGQITKGPGPMWFIFWLPACLALTRPSFPLAGPTPPAPDQPTRNSLAPS